MKQRGFTLIELLVVIAIIGILASIVMGALSSIRTKGRDAAVKSNMDAVANQAVIYQDANGGYGDSSGNNCSLAVFGDPTIQSALAAIDIANGAGAKSCYALDTNYAVAATRPAGTGYTPDTTYWCADSTGKKCGINDLTPLSSGSCNCP